MGSRYGCFCTYQGSQIPIGRVVYQVGNSAKIGMVAKHIRAVVPRDVQPGTRYVPDVEVRWNDGSVSAESLFDLNDFDRQIIEQRQKVDNYLRNRAALARKLGVTLPPV
jgi:hypothetical protein